MPSSRPRLTLGDATSLIRGALEPTGTVRVGLELEWLTAPDDRGRGEADFGTVRAVADAVPFPGGSVVHFEPGGQLELSGPPAAGAAAACRAMAADATAGVVRRRAIAQTAIDATTPQRTGVTRGPLIVRSPSKSPA